MAASPGQKLDLSICCVLSGLIRAFVTFKFWIYASAVSSLN